LSGEDVPEDVRETTVADATASARYAIIDDGGKQYTVREGDLVRVDLRDIAVGSEIRFERVLLIGSPEGTRVGGPAVEGASVVAVVEAEEKAKKVHGLRRRHHSRSKTRWGHRQRYTVVRVTGIEG
jgi:large subunit ribosomal protein L21